MDTQVASSCVAVNILRAHLLAHMYRRTSNARSVISGSKGIKISILLESATLFSKVVILIYTPTSSG